MPRKLLIASIAMWLTLGLASAALADQGNQAYIQSFDNGQIDWESGRVTAIGIGVPPANTSSEGQARAMAVRAATVIARRNLLEVIKGVRIDSSTAIQDYMVSNDTVVTSVRGYLQNSQILDTAYMSDGSVEVTVGVSLRDAFADAVLPRSTPFADGGAADRTAPTVSGMDNKQDPDAVLHTGIVIDARGLNGQPAMSPRVMDASGNELYGPTLVDRDQIVRNGLTSYAVSADDAMKDPRVGDSPILIKATGSSGKTRTDFIVSDSDAATIRNMRAAEEIRENCRVIIVLD